MAKDKCSLTHRAALVEVGIELKHVDALVEVRNFTAQLHHIGLELYDIGLCPAVSRFGWFTVRLCDVCMVMLA